MEKKLSGNITNTLKRKLESFKKKYPQQEVSLDKLKKVYISGEGDNKTKSAMGVARVNKFLEKCAAKRKNANRTTYKHGGEVDPDDKSIKNIITHKSGAAGGLLVGNRHSENGIKAINKSTKEPLEMEGGEVVITRDAVSDETKREFNGEMLTNRQILSRINESGGGVSFADGGDLPTEVGYYGTEYEYGGKTMKDVEIIRAMQGAHIAGEHSFKLGESRRINPKTSSRLIAAERLKNRPDYYSRYKNGGLCYVCHKCVPSFPAFCEAHKDRVGVAMQEAAYKQELLNEHNLDFDKQPQAIQIALRSGNQKLIDKYLNG